MSAAEKQLENVTPYLAYSTTAVVRAQRENVHFTETNGISDDVFPSFNNFQHQLNQLVGTVH